MSDTEPEVVKKPKRKCSDKQLANLQKGMEAIKAKREALAKARDEHEAKKAKGEIPADTPKPIIARKPRPVPTPVVTTEIPEVLVVKERKKTVTKPKIEVSEVRNELASMRAELSALKKPVEIKEVEKIVDRPVERIVEKTKVLSGSELLNSIFFK